MQAPPETSSTAEKKGDDGDDKQRCSVGILIKKDSKGNMKVRGFATGGPAERSGKIKVRIGHACGFMRMCVYMCVCIYMYVYVTEPCGEVGQD
jgi:hypothetical protein